MAEVSWFNLPRYRGVTLRHLSLRAFGLQCCDQCHSVTYSDEISHTAHDSDGEPDGDAVFEECMDRIRREWGY